MPDSPEHRADMILLARQRVASGKPAWDRTINVADILHDGGMGFEAKRNEIARRLRVSPWLKGADEFGALAEAVDKLAGAETPEEFDGWWDEIYDHADRDRVWINAF